MKVQVSRPFSGLSIAATIAFAAFAASAQTTPMMGGEMKDEDMVKGCDMMGGDMTCMMQMMSMMREKLSHAGDRVAALKADLKITEAQMPAWNKFADALLAAAKSMEKSMEGMHKQMRQSGAAASLPRSSNTMRKWPLDISRVCRRSRLRSNRFMPRSATNRRSSRTG